MHILTQQEMIEVCLKRKWLIAFSVGLCVTLAYGAWILFPKTFKSTAVVTIDSPKIPKEYIKGVSQGQEGRDDPTGSMIQQVNLGLTNQSILLPILYSLKPYREAEGKPVDQLMKRLRKAVVVTRAKDGPGVAISYTHEDPHLAQAVTGLLVLKLQEDNLKRRESLVETTTDFISTELNRVKLDLEVKEHAISEFKRAHIGELPQQMEANLRTLDRLQVDLTNTMESLNKTGERLTAIEKTIKELSDLGPSGAVRLGVERRAGDAAPVDSRAVRLLAMKEKLNELSATFKENYPDILYLKEEIHRLELSQEPDISQANTNASMAENGDGSDRGVRKPIDPYMRELLKERSEAKSAISFLKEKQANIARQIKQIEAHVERVPATEQSLAVLVRDYESMQKSYQALLDKRTNSRILENYESSEFGEQYRVIEAANFPEGPEPPTRIHFLLGGLFLGCLIGVGSALGVEMLRAGFRRSEEVEGAFGLPVIASIPLFLSAASNVGGSKCPAFLTGTVGAARKPDSYSRDISFGNLVKPPQILTANDRLGSFHMISKWGPTSLATEQYRVAATRLILMASARKQVVTLVTSSVMGEGKTTTAINLAYILANDLGKSVLLIDCDLKRPMVHDYMGIHGGPGLADMLQGTATVEGCLCRYEDLPLWILPAGFPRNPAIGLSAIQQLRKFLPDLRARYDHIILDSPPILPLADVNVLSGMADIVAFVIRASWTSQDIVKKALKSMGTVSDAGIILTQVEMEYAPYFNYAVPYVTQNDQN